eukprot:RCo051020
MMYDTILGTIGHTPLVRLNKVVPNPKVTVYAKLEGANPSGSIKDRIALRMIERAEASGELRPGQTILEPTSGGAGTGLAIVGIVKGYPVEIVMSEAVSTERKKLLEAYGAKVTLTDRALGTKGARERAQQLRQQFPDKYFMPNQFSNMENQRAHYETTAREIWEDTDGKVDYVVCAMGTSGTIMGISSFLKEKNPNIHVVCAQPERGHYIQGLKNLNEALVLDIYKPELIDEVVVVETEAAVQMAREIVQHEGIPAGMSSGAAMLAAASVAQRLVEGTMVVVFPDRCETYLSTKMFEPQPNVPCMLKGEGLHSTTYAQFRSRAPPPPPPQGP